MANDTLKIKEAKSKNIMKINEEIENFQGKIRNLEKNFVEIKRRMDEIQINEKEIDELTNKLKDYGKYKIIADGIDKLRKEFEEKNNLIIEIKERIKTAQKNKERAKGGKCPFLGEDCKNIGGNLEEYFENQIKSLKDELKGPEAEIVDLKLELEKAENASKTIAGMEKDKERLQMIGQRKSELYEDIKNVKAQINSNIIKESAIKISDYLSLREAYYRSVNNVESAFDTPEMYNSIIESLSEYIRHARQSYEILNSDVQKELGMAKSNIDSLNLKYKNLEKETKTLEEKQKRLNKKKLEISNKKEVLNQKKVEFQIRQKEILKYEGLDDIIIKTEQELNDCRQDYENNVRNQSIAEKLPGLLIQKANLVSELQLKKDNLEALSKEIEELGQQFNMEYYTKLESEIKETNDEILRTDIKLEQDIRNKDILENEISEMDKIRANIKVLEEKLGNYQKACEILEFIRNNILNKAGDKIADIYRKNISAKANEIYRQVSNENVNLEWEDEYEVVLTIKSGENVRRRIFRQFSGGEQMSAALAIRLALLGMLSNVKIGIFDEPTTNMDEQRRFNLAQVIPSVTKEFKQLFVISHDDSFDSITENVIHLQKTEEAGTVLVDT
ncbi:MAG: hypothetical protein ACUVWN_11375 [bacterium]